MVARRRAVVADEVARCALLFGARLTALLRAHGASRVATYVAVRGEADPSHVAAPELLAPRCVAAELEFASTNAAEWHRGAFGIPEPAGPAVDITDLDAVIVPGVAFTPQGDRLGLGAGYYDRLLPRLRADALTVGLCYDWQLVAALPVAPHDVAVRYVVTETRTLERDASRGARQEQAWKSSLE